MRQFGVKVMIALGGWNDSADDKYSRLVNDPAARKRFIDNVIDFIITHDFDGLDLDWEYPRCWQVNEQLLSVIDVMIRLFTFSLLSGQPCNLHKHMFLFREIAMQERLVKRQISVFGLKN